MNFHSMPDNSRVWIYQSNRALNDFEVSEINKMAQHFVPGWDAHGEILASNISVYHNIFIVVTVDESVTRVSGCAIDKSVGFIKRIEQQLNIQLFDRMNIAFKLDQSIEICSLQEFQQLINEGKVNHQTLVFNNLVATKKDFESNWLTPLEKSWHQRMLSMISI
jgi:hypothetical protein